MRQRPPGSPDRRTSWFQPAPARRHQVCRVRIPRRARYGPRYRPSSKIQTLLKSKSALKSETLPDVHHATTQPSLHRVHRCRKFLRQLLAAPAVVVGEQNKLLPIRLQPADALQKPLQVFRHLPPRQRIGRVGGHFHGARLVFDRRLAALAHDIDRPIARNRRHPGDRRRLPRIERSGAMPDLDVSFLYDLLSEILSPQDTEHDAEEFRPRGGIEPLKSGLIALRHRGNQPDQLSWRQHSASPKSRRPWFCAWASPCRITSWAKTVHRGSDDRRWEQRSQSPGHERETENPDVGGSGFRQFKTAL